MNNGINKMHQEWDQEELDFWDFWSEVQAFAEQYQLSTRYVEEEFLIDGELVPVHLTFPCEDDPDLHFGSEYESGIDYGDGPVE